MNAKLLIILTVSFAFSACPFGGYPDYRGAMSNKHQATSPAGAQLRSLREIDERAGAAIDAGIRKAARIAKEAPNNYTRFKAEPSNYMVWLWPRDAKRCQQPAIYQFFPRTNVYDQTEYDKDPRPGKVGLCFAGMAKWTGRTIDPDDIVPGMLIVDDAATWETIAWFEAEHSILAQADADRYNATLGMHSHPIMGEGGQPALATLAPETFSAGGFEIEKGAPVCVMVVK